MIHIQRWKILIYRTNQPKDYNFRNKSPPSRDLSRDDFTLQLHNFIRLPEEKYKNYIRIRKSLYDVDGYCQTHSWIIHQALTYVTPEYLYDVPLGLDSVLLIFVDVSEYIPTYIFFCVTL